jgi:DNA-binding CsgD family transcriptional regulator/acetolactate synthase regulatory subunit
MINGRETTNTAALRRAAEIRAASKPAGAEHVLEDWDAKRLFHELEVHQIELEMQHSELLESQRAVDLLLEELTNLYDFAPVCYLTLDREGSVQKCNFAAARCLDLPRTGISGHLFARFVAAADRPPLASFLEQVFGAPALKQTCRLRLLKGEAAGLPAQIEAQADATGNECLLAIVGPTRVAHSEESLTPQAQHRLKERETAWISRNPSPGSAAPSAIAGLSPRERDTLTFVVEGKTNAAIAKLMNISTKSVETYRSRLMLKLDIDNVPDLVKYALLHGVISL